MSEPIALAKGDALIVADVQIDFLPGGQLGVRRGDEVIGPVNGYLERFQARGLPIFLTRDWHPPNHCSFSTRGGLWAPHCVAGSEGAAFSPDLAIPPDVTIVSKATNPEKEAYSAFDGTGLAQMLRERKVERVYIGGLATDYCVLETVKDAIAKGFKAFVLQDAIRAIDVHGDDGARAEAEMFRLGAKPVTLDAIVT